MLEGDQDAAADGTRQSGVVTAVLTGFMVLVVLVLLYIFLRLFTNLF